MTVYIITGQPLFDGYACVFGVFSTEEAAKIYCDTLDTKWYTYNIEEWEVT